MSELFWTILEFPAWHEWQFWAFIVLPVVAAAWFIVQKVACSFPWLLRMICAGMVACFVFVFLGAFLSSSISLANNDSVMWRVALLQDDVPLRDATGEHFWRWELGSGQRPIIYKPLWMSTMGISPVTDNPKVRPLKYSVEVEVDYKNPGALARFFAQVHGKQTLDTFTRRLLFEFNERNSRRLGEFYNPLRDDQQAEFRRLVEEGIGKDLAKAGLRIISVRFDLVQ